MIKIYGQSPEHIENRAKANRGKKRTPAQRENIKAGLRAYWSNYIPKAETNPTEMEAPRESQPQDLPVNRQVRQRKPLFAQTLLRPYVKPVWVACIKQIPLKWLKLQRSQTTAIIRVERLKIAKEYRLSKDLDSIVGNRIEKFAGSVFDMDNALSLHNKDRTAQRERYVLQPVKRGLSKRFKKTLKQ
ncbi:MAG: hypothetical protein EZS28_031270 [Streblomastix strix]|uniref:Uncharacterized protein n=1 Tax=Streblomastix strix TaxID=222440 RepID=A0A5J4UU07_9EUKA|nr:MAG: hypothetical protein EZS28_031270 [Streblomastix strix]